MKYATAYLNNVHRIVHSMMQMNKSAEERAYLAGLMDTLERMKAENRDNEAFTNDIVAQSTIEAHALKLFSWADQQDR